jgi:cytidine deaminase
VSAPELLQAAWDARRRARAAFSHFAVGAAIECASGAVYGGCNIENATYGLTVCAERVALWKALSEGESRFTRIAVVAGSEGLTPPCGACRQILWEFCGDLEILLANLQGQTETLRLARLLPRPFDASFLEK